MDILQGVLLIILVPILVTGLVKAIKDIRFYNQATKDDSKNDKHWYTSY